MQDVNTWLCQINVAWNLKAEVTLSLSNFDNWTFELPWPLKVHRIFIWKSWTLSRTEDWAATVFIKKKRSILVIYSKTSWCIFLYWFSKHIVCVGIFVFRHPLLSLERELSYSMAPALRYRSMPTTTQNLWYFGSVTWNGSHCQGLCKQSDQKGQNRPFSH